MTEPLRCIPGRPGPLGATVTGNGVNFAIVSRHAGRVWLALFEQENPAFPTVEWELERATFRKGDVWCAFLEGLGPGACYMYRMEGPADPTKGFYFDPNRFLLDPYAKMIVGDVTADTARCLVVADDCTWAGDPPLRIPTEDTLIYEVHIKSFTAHPSSSANSPGTYKGFVEKIPHLKELGITAVQLLPVHHCGERLLPFRKNPHTGRPLVNLWGYQPIGYFAPDGWYATDGGQGAQVAEFRDLVATLHKAGIEVIVDVVFNHTAEYNETGNIRCFRGIDNPLYYHIGDQGKFKDFTGCGNTVNCNHPVVRNFILDCLRYWVTELHVDGFRFDLACVLNRDRHGHLLSPSPLIEQITEDPVLRDVKLIAEPWDLAGGFQLGGFCGSRWAEWNSRFRDDVRRFWRGDLGLKGPFAQCLTGSPDLFQPSGRSPQASINYVTAHDGFTLRDLVSYSRKHNESNGEDNKDGSNENFSWNCGLEGETDDAIIETLRLRTQKNCLATLFLSLGVPMLQAGDEFGRSQKGNNNAYCQDNEISWVDWTLAEKNAELLRFTKSLVQFRKENPVFRRTVFFTGKPVPPDNLPDIQWFDSAGKPQTWNAEDPAFACRIAAGANNGTPLYLMFNPSNESLSFAVPPGAWRLRINTAERAPKDLPDREASPTVAGGFSMRVAHKSLVVLSGA